MKENFSKTLLMVNSIIIIIIIIIIIVINTTTIVFNDAIFIITGVIVFQNFLNTLTPEILKSNQLSNKSLNILVKNYFFQILVLMYLKIPGTQAPLYYCKFGPSSPYYQGPPLHLRFITKLHHGLYNLVKL